MMKKLQWDFLHCCNKNPYFVPYGGMKSGKKMNDLDLIEKTK